MVCLYGRQVSVGVHRVMIDPWAGQDMRLLMNSMPVPPVSAVRWWFDTSVNSVALASFPNQCMNS